MLPTSIDATQLMNPDITARDFKRIASEIAGVPCYRPKVSKGDSKKPVSKYFGLPWMAEGAKWPRIMGGNPTFILQLDIDTLPDPYRSLLGSKGLLQMFFAPEADWGAEDDEDTAEDAVRSVATAAPDADVTPPTTEAASEPDQSEGFEEWLFDALDGKIDNGSDSYVSRPAPETNWDMTRLARLRIVHPDGKPSSCGADCGDTHLAGWTPKLIKGWIDGLDHPHPEQFGEVSNFRDDVDYKKLQYDPGDYMPDCYQGDKLGGWPSWTQGVETPVDRNGEPMEFVYQLDAGCFFDGRRFPAHAPAMFAGDGTGHIFVSKTDPNELKFVWACG